MIDNDFAQSIMKIEILRKETYAMLIMDENYLSSSPKITWATLFPRKTFCTPLKNALKKKSPDAITEYLHPGEGEEMQKVIVRMLIPRISSNV